MIDVSISESAMQQVQLKILDPRIGKIVKPPSYQTLGSAGIDLYACIDQSRDTTWRMLINLLWYQHLYSKR